MAVGLLLAATTVQAKKVITPKMYIFGFAASFNDSIVHLTGIQAIDSVWTDSKTKFLLEREQYSYQLRDYLASQDMSERTCIVVYNQDLKKLQKQWLKMKRLYAVGKDGKVHFDMRAIEDKDFAFRKVDIIEPVVVEE